MNGNLALKYIAQLIQPSWIEPSVSKIQEYKKIQSYLGSNLLFLKTKISKRRLIRYLLIFVTLVKPHPYKKI